MGAGAAVSRVFGAVRVLAIAAILGTTYLGNAFQGANTFSTVLFELLAAGALSAVLVPTFVEYLDRGDRRQAEHLAGGVLGVAMVALGVVAVAGMIAAPWLADLLTSAVDDPEIAAQQRDLTTFLLLFFLPQLVLYAMGAVSTAVLHAQRSFVIPSIAPIGNTVVLVAFLVAFRLSTGPGPGLDLSTGEQVLLGLGGTLGVAAFVAVPFVAVWRSGFSLRPRLGQAHAGLRRLLGLSGWASVQHAGAALLLGAAVVVGGGVEGGVIAYQVGYFFFLAPYGIIAQPIQTAILPELVGEYGDGDQRAFAASLRWALDSTSVLLLPLTALAVGLAAPLMTLLAFGQATETGGVDLLAAALASLALGLLPYGAFLLLARAWYVLGDSRKPAVASMVGAAVGVVIMVVGGRHTSGAGTVFVLGVAHSTAFLIGTLVLGFGLWRRTNEVLVPPTLPKSLALSVLVGLGTWAGYEWWAPVGRAGALVSLAVLGAVATMAYVGLLRLLGVSVTQRLPRQGAAT
jgi:putative peptidoglycan lipid II flippase